MNDYVCKHGKPIKWAGLEIDGYLIAQNYVRCDDCYNERWLVDGTHGHYEMFGDVVARILPESNVKLGNIQADMEE